MREIERSPEADDVWKRSAPPPYATGVMLASAAGFVIRYRLLEGGVMFLGVRRAVILDEE